VGKPPCTHNVGNAAQYKSPSRSCTYCGKTPLHACKYCAARDATCRLCGKVGHFQSVCRSSAHHVRGIHTANSISPLFNNEPDGYNDQSENGFLGAVTSETSLQSQWLVTIVLNGVPVEFNIDTGAEVTVITEDLYHQVALQSQIKLLMVLTTNL